MSATVRLGISTCPNDTFAFHGLLTRSVDLRGLDFHVELLDVQELNRRLLAGEFDVAKASFFAALLLADEVTVLPTGSALGFGVGPVLLAAPGRDDPARPISHETGGERPARVLCPGETTTAALLYELFRPGQGTVEHRVFSEIMPALAGGAADFGVCIHEGRFTYHEHGLGLVEDLGRTWEVRTGAPLPLGGIVGRRTVGKDRLARVQQVLRDSLDYAHEHRGEALETMRAHGQELDDDVLWAHVDLYVNPWTRDLGDTGRRALGTLCELGRHASLIPAGRELTVLEA